MPQPVIEIRGLTELQQRMEDYPKQLNAAVRKTMRAALLTLAGSVPPYPPPPADSTYVRTGTLGRTLGAGGPADVSEVKHLGSTWEAHFGTKIEYAPFVIGDDEQAHQNAHWWKISDVTKAAAPKIIRMFETLADKLAAFLDGKGG